MSELATNRQLPGFSMDHRAKSNGFGFAGTWSNPSGEIYRDEGADGGDDHIEGPQWLNVWSAEYEHPARVHDPTRSGQRKW
jgi:hypothetical protein